MDRTWPVVQNFEFARWRFSLCRPSIAVQNLWPCGFSRKLLLVSISDNRLTIFLQLLSIHLLGTGQQVSTISDTWRARISACAARFLSKHEACFVPAMPPPLLSPGYLGLWSAASLKGQNDVKAAAKLSGARSNFVH